jgi:hypothetical protein
MCAAVGHSGETLPPEGTSKPFSIMIGGLRRGGSYVYIQKMYLSARGSVPLCL